MNETLTTECTMTGCRKTLKSKGLCSMHYERQRTNGTTEAKPRTFSRTDPMLLFQQHISIDQYTGCWNWTASVNEDGYGQFTLNGRKINAHRASWILFVGPIDDGDQVDHLCRNRQCVHPGHLEPVTCRVNLLRGHTLAAANAAKTHCPQGHEYTAENTIRKKKGASRGCRECNRISCRNRRAEQKVAA